METGVLEYRQSGELHRFAASCAAICPLDRDDGTALRIALAAAQELPTRRKARKSRPAYIKTISPDTIPARQPEKRRLIDQLYYGEIQLAAAARKHRPRFGLVAASWPCSGRND
jgi:hypothetical protein